jgi:hypothetical protein
MNTLSEKLVEIAIGYLGPAGERFMERQVTMHLQGGITLDTLQPEHLPELSRWVAISSDLLLDNKTKSGEFAERVRTS